MERKILHTWIEIENQYEDHKFDGVTSTVFCLCDDNTYWYQRYDAEKKVYYWKRSTNIVHEFRE
jgi:hypothetical protein